MIFSPLKAKTIDLSDEKKDFLLSILKEKQKISIWDLMEEVEKRMNNQEWIEKR